MTTLKQTLLPLVAVFTTACAPSYQYLPYETQTSLVMSDEPSRITHSLEWLTAQGIPCVANMVFTGGYGDTDSAGIARTLEMSPQKSSAFQQMTRAMRLTRMTTKCGSPVSKKAPVQVASGDITTFSTGEYQTNGLTCNATTTIMSGDAPGGIRGYAVVPTFNITVSPGTSLVIDPVKDQNGDTHASALNCRLSPRVTTPHYNQQ